MRNPKSEEVLVSSFWHWFIVIGTGASLLFFLWLLLVNRRSDGGNTGHEWDGIEELDNPLPAWWVGMFIFSIIFSVGYLVIYPGLGNFEGALAWSSAGEHDTRSDVHGARFDDLYDRLASLAPEELAADTAGQQVGRRLFINNCSTCHGVNAGGAEGFPDLTDDHWIWGGSYEAIEHSITHGRIAAMPPWGPALGNDGVTNVANYVMQMAGLSHDPQRAEAGAAQYQVFCVSCHGAEGLGNPVLGAPNITSADHWIYGRELEDVARTIRAGRNGVMPGFSGLIDERQRKILATYVKGLSDGDD